VGIASRSFAGLVLVLVVGCHAGAFHGAGTRCDEQIRCRSPLVCVDHRCQLTEASSTSDAATSDAATSDAATNDAAMNDVGTNDAETGDGATNEVGTSDAADATDGASDADVDARGGDAGGLDVARPQGDPDHPPSILVFATTDNGGVWLVRVPAGSVAGPGGSIFAPPSGSMQVVNVTARAGLLGGANDVEAQTIGQEVHLLVRQGNDVYATSVGGDSWTDWRQVASGMTAMGLANLEGELWACLIDRDGRLRLAARHAAGDWQDMGDVMNAAPLPIGQGDAPLSLTKVDCAGMGADLEIAAVDERGVIWHAVKRRTGWSPFRALSKETGLVFEDVDVSNAVGELHILGSDAANQYHTLRTIDGTWQSFADVEGNVGDPMGRVVAGAQTAVLTELDWLQVNSFGQIWICSRFRYLPTPFLLLMHAAPDGHPFVSVAAAAVLPY
jgi:hypothetical protein